MKVVFPLLVAIGFHADTRESLYPLVLDAAALHVTAWAVEGFINRVLRRQGNSTSPAAMLHLQKGLILLRERLLGEDNKSKVSNSTMGVVLKLATTAHFDGDSRASKQHIEGLRKMVELRGGLDVFEGSNLRGEILR